MKKSFKFLTKELFYIYNILYFTLVIFEKITQMTLEIAKIKKCSNIWSRTKSIIYFLEILKSVDRKNTACWWN